MKIANVEAYWLRCPMHRSIQHGVDRGSRTHFDTVLVVVTTEEGKQGFGEAKASIGPTGIGAPVVSCIEQELKPILLGQDARNITRLWEQMYHGNRNLQALKRLRNASASGRKSLSIAAISGVDMALWDLLGKWLDASVCQLLGGAIRTELDVYVPVEGDSISEIGDHLTPWISKGFKAVKIRTGLREETVDYSIARIRAARAALGPEVKIIADAGGNFSIQEAKRFCKEVEDSDLCWLENPVSPDNKRGTAEVRMQSCIPIACGDGAFTRFDIKDLLELRAIDVVQPDPAILGGITESWRIAALAAAYQIELSVTCRGTAFSFMAGVHTAFASPAATIIEYAPDDNPMMTDLINEKITIYNGVIRAPGGPGLGLSLNWDFVNAYKQ